MMSIITISRGSYSHGSEVAEKVADKLGYRCISRDVLLEVSDEFNVSEIKLTRAISESPSIFERYTFGREKYIAYIQAAILEHLRKDNVVYHGFAGHFFVKDIPHVLKVRIIADMEKRVKCMMDREDVSSKEAVSMVKQVDEDRRKWSRKLYGMDTWDSTLYDLVINIEKITVDDAVDAICNMVKLKTFQTTPDSQKQMDELALGARKKFEEGHVKSPFFEPIRTSPWRKKK
jgi:cytidylate kinase